MACINQLQQFRFDGIGAAWRLDVNGKAVNGARILLVDDDVELLKALTKVLQGGGYTVVAQPNATSALNYLETTEQKFDLVLTDVSMPGMKGTALLSALKTAYPELPVIIITAFGDWDEYAQALREGVFEYLSKPIDKSEVLACVRRALESKTTG